MADTIERIAKAHNATVSEIALAWLLQRANNILLIPGTKSLTHLAENLRAGEIELTEDEFGALGE